MNSKQANANAKTLLRGLRVQLETAEYDLQAIRETIKQTKETIRTSREAIVRTNSLIQPEETTDQE